MKKLINREGLEYLLENDFEGYIVERDEVSGNTHIYVNDVEIVIDENYAIYEMPKWKKEVLWWEKERKENGSYK